MTQEVFSEQSSESNERRGRGPSKPYPSTTFEDTLILPKSILEHGINGEIERLALLSRLDRSPSSSRTRDLISSSSKYGLTTGSYNAQFLKVTDDGRALFASNSLPQEIKEKQFELAVKQFDHFNNLYEKLKNQRLPGETVLMGEFGRSGVSSDDCQKAANLFTANIRYIGLVERITGNDYVRTIEKVSEETSAAADIASLEPVSTDSTEQTRVLVEEKGKTAVSTNRPALHIDIQVHIDPTSSPEQIDHIFASMAKHLYGNES